MNDKINLLLADDHQLIVESLSRSLNEYSNLNVVAKASNGRGVLSFLKTGHVDIAVLDLNMPEMNGLECLHIIRQEFPKVKVIFLTIYQQEYVVKRLISNGAKGFLLKNVSIKKLVEAIQRVYEGGEYFDDLPAIYNNYKKSDVSGMESLTPREIEVIKLIVKGLPSHEIASQLHIAEFTVNTHRKNILRKLELANIAQLVAFAKSSGIIRD